MLASEAKLLRNKSCIQLMQYNGRGKEKDVGAGEEQSVWFGKL